MQRLSTPNANIFCQINKQTTEQTNEQNKCSVHRLPISFSPGPVKGVSVTDREGVRERE